VAVLEVDSVDAEIVETAVTEEIAEVEAVAGEEDVAEEVAAVEERKTRNGFQ